MIVVLIAIWALSDSDYFWPVWPMLGLAIALFFSALRAYGPRQAAITEAEIQREIDRRRS